MYACLVLCSALRRQIDPNARRVNKEKGFCSALLRAHALSDADSDWCAQIRCHARFTGGGTYLGIGRVNLVEKLLGAGANATVSTDDGSTCLHAAAERGVIHAISALLASQRNFDVNLAADDGKTALHLASEGRSEGIITLLLRAGAELEARIESTGATALMMAARVGSEAAVKALLTAGADVQVRQLRHDLVIFRPFLTFSQPYVL